MHCTSSLADLPHQHLVPLLLKSIPERADSNYAINLCGDNDSLAKLVQPLMPLSSSFIDKAIEKIILLNSETSLNARVSIAERKKRIAKNLSSIRDCFTNHLLFEQQKSMSLSFFESIAGGDIDLNKAPDIMRKYNAQVFNNAIHKVFSPFIFYEQFAHAELYLLGSPAAEPQYGNEDFKPENLYSCTEIDNFNFILIEGILLNMAIFNTSSEDVESVHRYSKLIKSWTLIAISANYCTNVAFHDQFSFDNKEVSPVSIALGIAAQSIALIEDKDTKKQTDMASTKAIIRSHIQDSDSFPYYPNDIIDEILNMIE